MILASCGFFCSRFGKHAWLISYMGRHPQPIDDMIEETEDAFKILELFLDVYIYCSV